MEDKVKITINLQGEVLVPRNVIRVLRGTPPPEDETPDGLERLKSGLQERDLDVPEAMEVLGARETTTRVLLHQLRVLGYAYTVPAPGHRRKQLWRYRDPNDE